MATLLEKALAAQPSPEGLDERLELALAYCAGHITSGQVSAALGVSRTNAYAKVGTILTKAVRAGLLVRAPKG